MLSIGDTNHRLLLPVVIAVAEDGTTLQGFLMSGAAFIEFEAPGVSFTLPSDINNRAQIVGRTVSDLAGAELHGFLLAKGIEGDFTPIDFPGALSTAAFGLNDRGQIRGTYVNPDAAPDGQPSPMRMPMMMSGSDG
jgi:hypothetical protein